MSQNATCLVTRNAIIGFNRPSVTQRSISNETVATIYQVASIISALSAILAAIVHGVLLFSGYDHLIDVVRRALLYIFVILCLAFLFSDFQPADSKELVAAPSRRVLLAGLFTIWIAYSILWCSDNLGFEFAKSIFGERLGGLWASSAYMWAFTTESALWRLKSRRRA